MSKQFQDDQDIIFIAQLCINRKKALREEFGKKFSNVPEGFDSLSR